MAVQTILHYPDARLQRVSTPVTVFDAEVERLAADLLDTLCAVSGCVGLAAPRIDDCRRVVIVDVSARKNTPNYGCMILVNPQILESDGQALAREGCLSVPDYTGNVQRAVRIHLRAQDIHGGYDEYHCEGYEARAVLHELDHLDGLLFLDRLVNRKRDLFLRKVYGK